MKLRRILSLIISALLGGLFLVLLIHLGNVNLRVTLEMLRHVSAVDFLELVSLNGLLVGLSTVKWRAIDAVLRRASDKVPSRMTVFFLSGMGMALGLILPVQLGMTAARTIGVRSYGGTLKRGTGGTVYEQGFDLLVIVILAGASAVAWFFHGGGWMWLACAISSIAVALLSVRPVVRLAQSLVRNVPDLTAQPRPRWLPERPYQWSGRLLRGLSDLQHSGLLNLRLARRLILLSIARFAVVVLMACQTARAIGVHIGIWPMTAAIPFASLANLFAVTPGGVGVNELTSATVLKMFGIPLSIASPWAIANRILVMFSCCVVVAASWFPLNIVGFAKIGKSRRSAL